MFKLGLITGILLAIMAILTFGCGKSEEAKTDKPTPTATHTPEASPTPVIPTMPDKPRAVCLMVDGLHKWVIVNPAPFNDQWELPGGNRDPGESPEAAAKRWVKFEVDLDVLKTKFLFPTQDTNVFYCDVIGIAAPVWFNIKIDQVADLGGIDWK